jgi:hypothetical protein
MVDTDVTPDPVEVNGKEPPIVGSICQRIVAIEYTHAGVVVEPASVIFLQFVDQWYRLYFDHGTIFWRRSTTGPEGFVAEEVDACFRPVEIVGFERHSLLAITYSVIDQGSEVRLKFESAPTLTFRCVKDVTSYE